MKQKETALVCFSGGQDSTTCLFWALSRFESVETVCFVYGQKHVKEVEVARKIAQKAGVPFEVLDVSLIGQLTHNSLTDFSMEMDREKPEDTYPNTFVPGRNMVFLTFAAIKAFDDAEAAYLKAEKVKRKIKIYDYLMETFDNKGPVASAFLRATAELLEKKVEERAKIFDDKLKVRFDVTEGLKPYFQFGENATFQTYYSLSTGQKIIASMLITDVLNFYCGSEILILDELNDLDEKNFEAVMKFITSEDVKEDYETIIVCTVNHKNLLDIMKRYKVQHVEL